ncbi:MAG: aminotransferase class V-fold PLP-dependent enzyme [Lachnospiraceae bacterium]|nr:aminotransferase class V-fold PLP-dependent enzyme [Lachnospiraceae bacterium]
MLHALEERGIYASAGSACSSHKQSISPTLGGMGLDRERAGSTLRFSFCFETTQEEIDYCLQTLAELMDQLRRYVRR